MSHTPGPWKAIGLNVRVEPNGAHICRTESANINWHACEANARLIAAAPAMLAALQEIVEATTKAAPLSGWHKLSLAIDKARDAIARATGATEPGK